MVYINKESIWLIPKDRSLESAIPEFNQIYTLFSRERRVSLKIYRSFIHGASFRFRFQKLLFYFLQKKKRIELIFF